MNTTARDRRETAMPAIGANTWIWVSPLDDAGLAELAPQVQKWGFEVIELPLENPDDLDVARTQDLLAELGLGGTVCVAMSPERTFIGDDPDVLESTRAYLRACIDLAAAVGTRGPGGAVVGGPMYAPVGLTWRASADERATCLDRLVEGLVPVADYAGERGVRLAIEPLNRFETSLLNTFEQVLEVLDRIGRANCGVLADTFHMNIEEKSILAALRSAGSRLVHVQACGNDRGTPGADHVDWVGFLGTLAEIGYPGTICIESFTPENQSIARAASIWRPLAASQDAIAIDGLAFLRRALAELPPAAARS
jgi:D-psicose/D-tagatose/L-ribulose 3-epimerase